MNKQLIVYYGINISERAEKILCSFKPYDVQRLTLQFRQAIISKEERNYRFLYKGYLLLCTMSEHKNIIEVKVNDVYHI